MANIGEGKYQDDLEVIKTDDIASEEVDIFERVKKFEELQKRFDKHRDETRSLRGNDLRYNIYIKKMQKLIRMDIGLDVEMYKDYVNNLKIFAQYNKDYEVLADDNMSLPSSAQHKGKLLTSKGQINEEYLERIRMQKKEHTRLE
jgi:hypothetical protein